jgi:hypothetical protein
VETPPVGSPARCRYCRAELPRPETSSEDPLGNFFADRDGNGVPDVLDGMLKNPGASFTHQSTTHYVVNGVRYDRMEDVPEEMKVLLRRTQGLLDDPVGAAPPFAPRPRADTTSRLWILLAVAAAFVAGIALVLWLR